jgi:hypothetical protein
VGTALITSLAPSEAPTRRCRSRDAMTNRVYLVEAAICWLEGYLTQSRTIIEFLWKSNSRDIRATDFIPSWVSRPFDDEWLRISRLVWFLFSSCRPMSTRSSRHV